MNYVFKRKIQRQSGDALALPIQLLMVGRLRTRSADFGHDFAISIIRILPCTFNQSQRW